MIERLKVSMDRLARHLARPGQPGKRRLHSLGKLHALAPASATMPGRWQTLIIYETRFLLLIDEFYAPRARPFTLTLMVERALRGGRHRYVSRDETGPLAVHLLGDYALKQQRGSLTLEQRFVQGRFLVALTRDTEASVRVLNGWAIEVRSEGHVYHLLHSNRSRKVRPLGPVQTDALFALADWPEGVLAPSFMNINLHVLQASQVLWGEDRKLTADQPVNLLFQRATPSTTQSTQEH